jgi:hypothetical protein
MPLFLHAFGPANILSSIPSWLIILIVAVLGAYIFVRHITARKTDDVAYVKRPFLSNAEVLFLATLEKVCAPQYRVFAQVPLTALLNVNCDDKSKKISKRNSLDRKTVDFVLVDPQTFEVQKVVELDDRSHDGQRRKDRDVLVDDALGRASIPIVHCKCKASYDAAALRVQLSLPSA